MPLRPWIGVVGSTGNVGRLVVQLLLERKIVEPQQLQLFASHQSHGKTLDIHGASFIVQDIAHADFCKIQICLFNTEGPVSREWIPKALAAGAFVVDSSSHYRLDPCVPLIVPPVNLQQVVSTKENQRLYAHANCLTSPIATVLAPLQAVYPIRYLNIATYQATSGAGKQALDECRRETQAILQDQEYQRHYFKRQIAFNVIPQVGTIQEDGMSYEEYKIIHELQKVLNTPLAVSVTAVRVPVLIGHSMALTIDFLKPFDLEHVMHILSKAPQVQLSQDLYHTPAEVVGSDDVFVGRIRPDPALTHGLQLWLCSDNLRRGAATDSVEIAAALL